ncbi:MAG: Wzz/FepE/Etk N-terminal domain-containing protein, partial [Flavobacteriales bacterium]|nr:Wzz/FepE/Etk N-terminal domain-containing protein [Flavobacteriales bacterium]
MQEDQFAHKKEIISNFNTELDIILLLKVFKKTFIYFVVIIAVCLALSLVYLRYTVPIYQSKLVLQVGSENTANKVLQVDNFNKTEDVAKDVELLRSKLLLKRALSKLPLDVSYFNQGKILEYELYKNSPFKVFFEVKDSSVLGKKFYIEKTNNQKFNLFQSEKLIGEYKSNAPIELKEVTIRIVFDNYNEFGADKNNAMFFAINDLEALTNRYIQQLGVFPLNPSAKTISISFVDNNALKTSDIITSLANEYILYDIEERSKSSKKIIQFLD